MRTATTPCAVLPARAIAPVEPLLARGVCATSGLGNAA